MSIGSKCYSFVIFYRRTILRGMLGSAVECYTLLVTGEGALYFVGCKGEIYTASCKGRYTLLVAGGRSAAIRTAGCICVVTCKI